MALRTSRTVQGRYFAANISGTKVITAASRALLSTGISMISPRTRSGHKVATSSDTFAPREAPPMTACGASRWSSSATTCAPNPAIE